MRRPSELAAPRIELLGLLLITLASSSAAAGRAVTCAQSALSRDPPRIGGSPAKLDGVWWPSITEIRARQALAQPASSPGCAQ